MTSQSQSNSDSPKSIGALLRRLRNERGLPLREVAPVAEMDTALLSKIENGARLPTPKQTVALATFFSIAVESLEALRLAEKFWRENHDNPAAHAAAALIEETAGGYGVKKPLNKLERTSSSRSSASPIAVIDKT